MELSWDVRRERRSLIDKGGHLQPFPKPQPSRLIYMQLFTCAVNSNYVYRCLLNIYGKGTSAWLKYPYKGLDRALFFFSYFFFFFFFFPRAFVFARYLATAKSNLHKLLAADPAATTGPGAGIFGASGARRLPPPPRPCTLAVPSAERLSAAGVPLS